MAWWNPARARCCRSTRALRFRTANFSPPFGAIGSGTIRGLGEGTFDIVGTGGAEGVWDVNTAEMLGVLPTWDVAQEGTPSSGGAVLANIEYFQDPGGSPNNVLTTNPVHALWRGLWTPASYSVRSVDFDLAPDPTFPQYTAGGVFLRLSSTMGAGVMVNAAHIVLGDARVQIVPAPISALLLAGLPLRPRRYTRGSLEGRAWYFVP